MSKQFLSEVRRLGHEADTHAQTVHTSGPISDAEAIASPDTATSEDVTAEDVASEDVAAEDVAAEESASENATAEAVTAEEASSDEPPLSETVRFDSRAQAEIQPSTPTPASSPAVSSSTEEDVPSTDVILEVGAERVPESEMESEVESQAELEAEPVAESGADAAVEAEASGTSPESDALELGENVEATSETPDGDHDSQELPRVALEEQVADLKAQLGEQAKTLEQLRIELNHAHQARTALAEELEEAKRYILNLTKPSPSAPASPAASLPSAPPATSAAPKSYPRPEPGRSPQRPAAAPPARAQARSLPPMPTERSPERSPSSGRLSGLPPMSTEQFAVPSKPPSSGRTPLQLPERSNPGATKANTPAPNQDGSDKRSSNSSTSQSFDKLAKAPPKGTPDAAARTRSPFAARRGERPIPESARNRDANAPKPKLSDSDIGWFD